MECAICKCDMNVNVFEDAAEEGDCGEHCFRLPCKHAFHTACLVKSLRSVGKSCPVCRDNGGANAGGPMIISIDLELPEDEEEQDDDELDMEVFTHRLLQTLNSSNLQVRAAKQNLNQSIKEYNVFRDKLRRERRQRVVEAMAELRKRQWKNFLTKKHRVRLALQAYNREVQQQIQAPENFVWSNVDELLTQANTLSGSVRRQDPMRRSFWHA